MTEGPGCHVELGILEEVLNKDVEVRFHQGLYSNWDQ